MRRPGSAETSGLVANLDGVPVGWCAVEPRRNDESLLRNHKVPWSGRNEDKRDCTVWAITCLYARAGFADRASAGPSSMRLSASRATVAPEPSRPTR